MWEADLALSFAQLRRGGLVSKKKGGEKNDDAELALLFFSFLTPTFHLLFHLFPPLSSQKHSHGHRRKAATPLRAPEAASPEWYDEVQLPLLVARLLSTSSSHRKSSPPPLPLPLSLLPPPSSTSSASTSSLDSLSNHSNEDNNGEHLICSKCSSEKTPMWRRMGGALLCNACGLRARRAAATRTRDELVAAGKGRVVAAAEAAVAAANGEDGRSFAVGRSSRLAKASASHAVVVVAGAAPAPPASAASDATAVEGEETGTETETETDDDKAARRSSSIVFEGMDTETRQQQQQQQQHPCLAFAAVGA
jgi:hypothetical protein